jgi:hypothetical protein
MDNSLVASHVSNCSLLRVKSTSNDTTKALKERVIFIFYLYFLHFLPQRGTDPG